MTPRSFSGPRRARGQVFVVFALALVGLVGMLGLVLDGGVLYMQRRTAQNAADAGALAGAYALNVVQNSGGSGNDSTVATAICTYARLNRFDQAPQGITANFVDANVNPLSSISVTGSCTTSQAIPSSATGVQVAVTVGPYNTYLVGIVGVRQLSAGAHATASISGATLPQAVAALNATVCASLSVTQGSTVTVVNGGIQVNSNCNQGALQVDGGSSVRAAQGAIAVVGSAQVTGGSTVSPAATTGAPTIGDPFASLPIPTVTGLQGKPAVTCNNAATMTIDPGIYPSVSASGGCTLTMNPGNYIIGETDNRKNAGRLELAGAAQLNIGSAAANTTIVLTNGMSLCCVGGALPVGTNVLFYNACRHYALDLPAGCRVNGDLTGPIVLSGGIDMSRVTPQTTGPYRNMTIFQDRVNAAQMSVSGGVILSAGTIYGPAMPLTISGGVTAPVQFIVDSLSLTGGSTLTDTVTASQKASGARVIGMTQ